MAGAAEGSSSRSKRSRGLRGLRHDFRALRDDDANGAIVAAPVQDGYDTFSRCFQPWVGVDEGPDAGATLRVFARFASGRLGPGSLGGCQAPSRRAVVGMEVMPEAAFCPPAVVSSWSMATWDWADSNIDG